MSSIFQRKLTKLLIAAIFVFSMGISASTLDSHAKDHNGNADIPSEEPNLVFPVISDTQIGRGHGELGRFDNAMQQLNRFAPKQDAFVFVGDLTEDGTSENLDDWNSVFRKYVQSQAEQLIGIGNHEFHDLPPDEAKQQFLDKTGMKSLYYHKNIKGYDFIMMGEEENGFYSKDQVQWVGDQLKQAEKRDPDKPIFVALHHAIKDTTYGSHDWYIDDDNQKLLDETLGKYPQVIVLAAHTHYPVSDPRSIYQKNYTAVNTGSVGYLWTETGYLQGEIPPESDHVSNGLLVKVYDHKVVIKRRNFGGERWIGQPWVIDTTGNNKDNFKYTDDRDQESPVFEDDASITINQNKTSTSGLNISFTQATDNILTHSYKVTARNQKTGEVDNQYKAFSEYYRPHVPDTLQLPVDKLKPATTYNISVRAIDAFGNTSKNTLSTTASTFADKVAGMKNLVKQFEEDGKLENQNAARSLEIHLSAVNHYRKQDQSEKAVKHMKGFKLLLEHQRNNNLISEKTYHFFDMNADHLLEKWQ